MNKNEIIDLLNHYGTDPFCLDIKDFVQNQEFFWRGSNTTGHITASAWVLSEDFKKVLLLHHRKLDKWLQPGGHIEDTDKTFFSAVRREVIEETGIEIKQISDKIFDVDIHKIPESKGFPSHFHYDIRALVIANKASRLYLNEEESHNLKWFDLTEVNKVTDEWSVLRMVDKTLNK